jgi:hypothetical protein
VNLLTFKITPFPVEIDGDGSIRTHCVLMGQRCGRKAQLGASISHTVMRACSLYVYVMTVFKVVHVKILRRSVLPASCDELMRVVASQSVRCVRVRVLSTRDETRRARRVHIHSQFIIVVVHAALVRENLNVKNKSGCLVERGECSLSGCVGAMIARGIQKCQHLLRRDACVLCA